MTEVERHWAGCPVYNDIPGSCDCQDLPVTDAERIKELEARVAEPEAKLARRKGHRAERKRYKVGEIDEPTDEDRYGWGGQG